MTVELRPYQKEAIAQAWQALKENDNPVAMELSVGAGKSIVIASMALTMDKLNKRTLCLVNSAELVRNNSDAYKQINGTPSVFCASLLRKTYNSNTVYATPQSIIKALEKKHPLSDVIFNLIIVDECHTINPQADHSAFMRILRHYKQSYPLMRVLGLTGTPFRGSDSIVGPHAFFKKQVGNISTQYLISKGFLVPPVFGYKEAESIDFSNCKPNKHGEFNGAQLQKAIDTKKRLTWHILQEAQVILKDGNCAIIFCATKRHCFEAFDALPEGTARIILGDTPDKERHEALTLARECKIKWLISVNCLLVGVNIPKLDGIVWLRPTSSLLLYIQGIGRGLRLAEGKTHCTILDYADNASRFQDIDDPIINQALKPPPEKEQAYIFPCHCCNTLNTAYARRCIGISGNQRCEHYFAWKECDSCKEPNDTTARQCRKCNKELIDPNNKLKKSASNITVEVEVKKCKYWTQESGRYTAWRAAYLYQIPSGGIREIQEYYTPASSDKAKNIFYTKFVKLHLRDASFWYPHLTKSTYLQTMTTKAMTPTHLVLKWNNNEWKIFKRIFPAPCTSQ